MAENISGRVRLPKGFDSQAESVMEGTLVIEQGALTFPDGTFFTSSIDPATLVSTSSFNAFVATYNTGSFTGSFRGDGSGLTGIAGGSTNTGSLLLTASVLLNTITFTKGNGSTFPITVNTGSGGGGSTSTGSLLTTASFSSPNLTFIKGDDSTFNVNISSITNGLVASSQTSSMSVLSSSFATTASYVGGIYAFNYTASFINQSTWTVNHNLGTRTVMIQAFDNNFQQIVPQDITLTNSNTATITFPTTETGFAVASVGGAYNVATASVANLATTASYVLNAVSSSFAVTASSVNTLNQNVIISGSLTVGSTTAGVTENTLTLGARDNALEGGQLGLNAPGGTYTSASMLDVYQNQFRLLKGTNTGGSTVAYIITDLQTGNTQFAGAVTASAYSGLPNSWLHALRSGNQSIGSGTWANRDVIFNDVASINFTYNSSTGVATLRAGKTYRITARIAWAAAGVYVLQHRVYNQTTSTFTGPTAEMVQSSNGTNNISDGTLEHIFNVGASDVDISIRTTSATNALTGESIRGDLNTQLIIQQIA